MKKEQTLSALLQVFALVKVPLLGLVRPRVLELSKTHSRVLLPLNFLTKNHLGSMYFGALAMGAELSIALKIVEMNRTSSQKVSFIFKDFNCEFHRRAETDVVFSCADVAAIESLVSQALATGERINQQFSGVATNADASKDDAPLMSYRLTISVKSARG